MVVPIDRLAGKPKLIRKGVRIKPPPKPKKPDKTPTIKLTPIRREIKPRSINDSPPNKKEEREEVFNDFPSFLLS
ncbi:MAG: hypothetical protein QXR74_00145 [Candidatus Bathyarchaeia archaeon]